MNNQMSDFDDFAFDPGEAADSSNRRFFADSPDSPPSNPDGGKQADAPSSSATPVVSHDLPRLAAQVVYQAAQQTTAVIEAPVEHRRTEWSAALEEEVTLMEALATAVSRTPKLTEALALGASLPVCALRLTPHSYRALWPTLPTLMLGVQSAIRLWHKNEATRDHICLLPAILENSVAHLADQVAAGRAPDASAVARVLAQFTGQALQNKQRRVSKRRQQDEWQGNGHGNGY